MKIKSFRNRFGRVKLSYRKIYRLFGKKRWFVTSTGLGRTYVRYNTLDEALAVYNTIQRLLETRVKR